MGDRVRGPEECQIANGGDLAALGPPRSPLIRKRKIESGSSLRRQSWTISRCLLLHISPPSLNNYFFHFHRGRFSQRGLLLVISLSFLPLNSSSAAFFVFFLPSPFPSASGFLLKKCAVIDGLRLVEPFESRSDAPKPRGGEFAVEDEEEGLVSETFPPEVV